jgi:hypothetical protein
MSKHSAAPQLPSSYARATTVFVIFAVVIAAGALYLSLARTVITITPRTQSATVRFPVTIREPDPELTDPLPAGVIAGQLLATTETASDTFTPSGEGSEVPAKASGRVTIFNTWSRVQPLAATTRLLSESGVLFRLKERVDVPPGGSIETEVEADQPGAAGDIAASHFTLPGLWPGLQEQIYAESTKAMSGGIQTVKIISQGDLRTAEDALAEKAAEAARTGFLESLADQSERYELLDDSFSTTVTSSNYSVEVGDEASEFTATLKIRVEAVAFASGALDAIAESKIAENIPEHTVALGMTLDKLSVNLDRINADTRTADLSVSGEVPTTITLADPIFDRVNLTNRDAQSIRTYFSAFDEIASVEIKFSPFWSTRSSSLPDHIEIRLADAQL